MQTLLAFSTVETWKYHDKPVKCPACGVKDVPISFTKQQKFTNSRLAALCLLGLVDKIRPGFNLTKTALFMQTCKKM